MLLCLSAVYADGGICLDILQNQWSPIYDVSAILTSIQASGSCGERFFSYHWPALICFCAVRFHNFEDVIALVYKTCCCQGL